MPPHFLTDSTVYTIRTSDDISNELGAIDTPNNDTFNQLYHRRDFLPCEDLTSVRQLNVEAFESRLALQKTDGIS